MKYNRVTIPEKLMNLMFSDDKFFSEVLSVRKLSLSKFPRSDQWVDEEGFRVSFALAGYSKDDIEIFSNDGRVLTVRSKQKASGTNTLQKGFISRGIAGRNFEENLFIHTDFDPKKSSATMENGLLTVTVPRSESEVFEVKIL